MYSVCLFLLCVFWGVIPGAEDIAEEEVERLEDPGDQRVCSEIVCHSNARN